MYTQQDTNALWLEYRCQELFNQLLSTTLIMSTKPAASRVNKAGGKYPET